jgi:hypothetical protein
MSKENHIVILCTDIWRPGHFPSHFGFRFERNGYEVRNLAYSMMRKGQTVEEIARGALKWARDLRDRSTHTTFIGHGIGGRIGMEMLDLDPVIFDSFVSIATPYKASPVIASLGDIEGLQGILKAFTPLTMDLRKDAKVPEQLVIPALTVGAQFDGLYAPVSTTPIIEDHQVIPMTTHTSVVTNSRTYLEILGWMNYAEDMRKDYRYNNSESN